MISTQETVKDIAIAHPLATRVFERHSIDFCCRGGRTLSAACDAKGLDAESIVEEVETAIAGTGDTATRWENEAPNNLIDHILTTYHEALRSELPRLQKMADKVLAVHGDKMPEVLGELQQVFTALRMELQDHMMKEEQILFPMIRAGRGADAGGPISVMEHEHASAGAALERLRELTNDFQPPEGACATWTGLWAGLADLEKQLHLHIHLENNILFPQAAAV
ncbi:MAG: iron-sulfur cluster repair di-iron protein [Gemmatimonadota bacterium]